MLCIVAHGNLHFESSDDLNYYHFHMALRLEKSSRWLQVEYLNEKFGIQVHFSDHHNGYHSVYKYVTKEDTEALQSPGHPDLTTVPKTETAIAGKKQKAKEGSAGINKKRDEEILTVYEVCKIIQVKSITTRLELVCLTTAQEREGKPCLVQFIANCGQKAVDEALALAKEFSTAESLMANALWSVRVNGSRQRTRFWQTKKLCQRFFVEPCTRLYSRDEENSVTFNDIRETTNESQSRCH